jgi:glutaminyl-tRNA synthetase
MAEMRTTSSRSNDFIQSFEIVGGGKSGDLISQRLELGGLKVGLIATGYFEFFRMYPGGEVRLMSAYIVKCTGCKKDDAGNVIEVYAEYDPETKTGMPGSNRKVKGTLHWVSCAHCIKAEVRLYDRLWKVENPRDEMAAIREAKGCDALEAMKEMINPDSLQVLTECYVERYLAEAKPLDYLQFRRIGYFNLDKESTPEHLVFNRTVALKDSFKK